MALVVCGRAAASSVGKIRTESGLYRMARISAKRRCFGRTPPPQGACCQFLGEARRRAETPRRQDLRRFAGAEQVENHE